ncbi:MAG: 1-(5-phosphoribosyl)-5-[(5-phosphoribosylamino)methylideneamino]imidazole-4-carboxamide isomerase [Candidatus Bathycorpusculaceae bacterium]
MKVFPAIDLMDGKVVRLFTGDPKTAIKYNHLGDPLTFAKKWEKEGAETLHIVDLDAAFGRGNNLEIIAKIIEETSLPVHVGGGIRSLKSAKAFLNKGVSKIMLGTLAYKEPNVIGELNRRFGDRVIVALDHIQGIVMIEGWKTSTGIPVQEAMRNFLKLKVKTFLLTSVAKDGTFQGVDMDVLKRACAIKQAQIIAAGGVGSLRDISIIKQAGAYGVVIGKALYEGKFTLREALKVAKGG